jgi:type IV secretory pathway VirB10-like protein
LNVPAKEDPAKLELRAKPAPVRRLNRRTLLTLVGGLALCVLLATLWAFRTPPDRRASSEPPHNVERVTPAEGLQTLPSDYAKLSRPKPPALPREGEELPRPSDASDAGQDKTLKAEQQRLQAEADEAAKAPVLFQTARPKTTAFASSTADDGAPAWTVPPIPSPATPSAGDELTAQNRQAGKQAFVDGETQSRIYGSAALQVPRSSYQLMAGTVIPAALLTGINSDLPGQVIATVTEHVYDTVSGRFLLIPQGSRLLGQYDSQVAYGQRRVLLVWTRLIRPDGSSIVLDRLPAVDVAGQAGLEDRVDWHWGRIFAGAALSTLLGVGAELAAPDRVDAEGRVIIATRESAQETINEVGQQVTRRNLNLQPTLTVRPGFPVRVVVNHDLVFQR